MMYRRLLFLWLLTVMFVGYARAQVYTDHIVRNFKVSDRSVVEVTNKYGKIHIRTWDKDSVKFIVDLKIQTSNPQKLQKLKSQVDFDFTSTNYYVVARTKFSKSGGVFSDVVETFVPSNTVTINYTIYLPKSTNLKIENKFGDVYLDDLSGNLTLKLSNGNLKANHLAGYTTLNIASGDGMVNKMDKGKVTVAYSDFQIRDCGDIEFDTRSSRIEIRKAKSLKVYSRRDKYFVDAAGLLIGDGNFTTIELGELNKELNVDLKYGEVRVERIAKDFSLINILSAYTDISLYFKTDASYNLDITHHEDVYLMYPTKIKSLETKKLDDDTNTKLTYGMVGNPKVSAVPKVKILAEKKCYLSIVHE